MVDRLEPLPLPFVEEAPRRKRRSRPIINRRSDRGQFYDDQIQKINELQENLKRDKKHYSTYLDPNLIFKIVLNQDVDEEQFRSFLKRKKIEVISPSPDKKGFWVVFAEDETLEDFKEKLREYAESDRHIHFHAIDDISEIPPDEKIGEGLKKDPLKHDETAYLDVEIWRMDDDRLNRFIYGLRKLIEAKGGKITDRWITKSFCLLRVKIGKQILDEILPLREIARIDRPPKAAVKTALYASLEEIDTDDSSPDDNATGILMVDSGIRSAHPLLKGAVGDEIAVATKKSDKISEDDLFDEVGHGTKVAGIALYGDLKRCLESKRFTKEVWIFSAKVMYMDEYGNAKYDEEELLEHQLYKAVKYFVDSYPNCKVINLSLGDDTKIVQEGMRQFPLASVIDEMTKEFGVVFVISAGNINDWFSDEKKFYLKQYPDYLIDSSNDFTKITDPATSALALTVGSVFSTNDIYVYKYFGRFGVKNYPSPFTRVGFGYKGMIKPEIVENGGGDIAQNHVDKVVTLNPEWISEGRLFTLDCGTSFSAPKVAHYIAKLMNEYPNYSPNLVKALLISSASIPNKEELPDELRDENTHFEDIIRIYGYGIPNLDRARYSEKSRVLLLRENKIKLNSVHLYAIYLPDDFNTSGKKKISVTLVYDSPTNRNRSNYLGVSMEFHLFRDLDIEIVKKKYSETISEDENEEVPEDIKSKELNLKPGVRLRKKGVHQKGTLEFSRMEIDTDKPLVLAVICRDVWVNDKNYQQDYAVVVEIEHSASIDLYNQIRLRNRERLRV